MKVQLLQIWRRMIDKMCCSSQFWLSHWGSWKCGFSGPHSILNVEMLIWAQFFPQLSKIQWSAPLGPRRHGPSLRAFLLLAALSSRLFVCCVVQSAPLLIVCCAMFFLKAVHVDPFWIIFCYWFLSLWRVQVLTGRWTFYFCCLFSALPDLGGLGESASHPTSPFSLWKGECHKCFR